MEDLNLPVIKENTFPKVKKFSMDEYLQFVQSNLENCFDRKVYLAQKKLFRVNVPFVIKEN